MHLSEVVYQKISSLHGTIVSRFFCPPRALGQMTLLTKKPMYKAVIFDKDGTLICFDTMWNSWAKVLTKKLTDQFGKKLESPIYNLLGVCAKTSTVLPGLLAEGTKEQILSATTNLLFQNGIERGLALETVQRHMETTSVTKANLKELEDIKHLFTVLQRNRVKVCVCTADSRSTTEQTLRALEASHLVNIVKAADDEPLFPKPHPYHAKDICSRLGLPPSEIMMVGDTPTDILFAKNAGLGHAVGVLSGIGEVEHLRNAWYSAEPSAQGDFTIVDSIADILPIVFPNALIPVAYSEDISGLLQQQYTPKIRLVILGKDGVLSAVYPRWSNWAREISSRLSKVVSDEFARLFLRVVGFRGDNFQVTGSALGDTTVPSIRDKLLGLLLLNGARLGEVNRVFDEVWVSPSYKDVAMVRGGKDTLVQLKKRGLKVAINSNDEQGALDMFMLANQLFDTVDMAIFSEESGRRPKPHADSVMHICKELKVPPAETLIVGGTAVDMACGAKASCGGSVGVLSGFATSRHLFPLADVIAPDITYLPELLDFLKSSTDIGSLNTTDCV